MVAPLRFFADQVRVVAAGRAAKQTPKAREALESRANEHHLVTALAAVQRIP